MIVLLLLLLLTTTTLAASPSIDWSGLGQVSLLGSFSTLSLSSSSNPSSQPTLNPSHPTLIRHSLTSKDEPTIITSNNNQPGSINALCTTKNNKIIIGGRFDSLNSTPSTANIAIYDPESHTIAALSNSTQIQGTVHAISCQNDNQIWIAGQFQNPISNNQIPNIITWSTASKSYESPNQLNLPNFNGPIYSLDHRTTSNGESLIIAGQFSIIINTNNNNNNKTSQSPNFFEPNKTKDQPPPLTLGSSLAPIPISNDATWNAAPQSTADGFQNPQNIFCPQGPDGPGNTWELDHNFDNGAFTLNLGTSVPVGGIRLGNSFVNGGGTAGFHVVSLPDNQVLNLTFINPITNQLDSCTSNCTLSRDLNLSYQDYLFPPNLAVSGIQLVITSKFGKVAGLHLLQLLSQGNTAYAVDKLNSGRICKNGLGAAGQNTVKTSGNWNTIQANTNLPGTVQPVLQASAAPGTTPDNGPSLTWTMWVPQSGHYELVMQTPGCSSMNDCPARTSLAVTTSLVDGSATKTVVDTRTPNEKFSTLYNGTLTDVASGGGNVTVTVRLADTVSGSSPASIVASQIVLRSDVLGSHIAGVRSNGIYEHVLAGKGAFGDGTTAVDETAIDQLGTRLHPSSSVRSVVGDDHVVFVGGNRLSVLNGTSAVTTTTTTPVPNGGLNGAVNALLAANGVLYAGGNFTGTLDGSVKGLDGLACWKYGTSSTKWEGFSESGSSVGFPVEGFQLAGESLYVYGRSTEIGGRALGVYSTRNSSWVPSTVGVYYGQLTAAATSTSGDHPMLYLAGNLNAVGSFEAPSGALLSTGPGGSPSLSGLNFEMNHLASQIQASAFRNQTQNLAAPPSSIPSNSTALSTRSIRQIFQRRQAVPVPPPTTNNNLNVSLPYALTGTSGATILTGAFYKEHELMIGGRFTTSNAVTNVGIYDLSGSVLRPLNGTQQLEGSVLSIKLVQDVAWIGGIFTSPSGKIGLDTYNLTTGKWATEKMAGIQGYPNTNVSVRSIKSRSTTGDVIIGGRFQSVGSLSCQSICLWSNPNNQWYNLGGGLKGVVNGIEIIGKLQDKLIAIGRFEINSTATDVGIAKWTLNSEVNPIWLPIGSQDKIPGTIKSLAVGELSYEGNEGMYIAGFSNNNLAGNSFLMNWKNNDWNLVDGIDPDSIIEHIAFVPIRNPSASIVTVSNGIKSDRMLLVSGSIILPNHDSSQYASVLYDGHQWIPYIVANDYSAANGVLARFISSSEGFKSTLRHVHSVVQVIFISMSIALGIVLLGILIGFLIGYKKRRSESKKKPGYPNDSVHNGVIGGPGISEDEESEADMIGGGVMIGNSKEVDRDMVEHHTTPTKKARRPASLFATLDAATSAMTERMENRNKQEQDNLDSPNDNLHDSPDPHQTFEPGSIYRDSSRLSSENLNPVGIAALATGAGAGAAAAGHGLQSPSDIDNGDHFDDVDNHGLLYNDSDVRRARWSFDPQLPGEIAVAAGESVEVKDRSNQEWWLVRRADGVEGVVPADWFL
ncbi:hypothetical protein MJO28_012667 [Puccinia striiformis f. sp. tritici]|uniref:Uncharacterized protein n=1 Tax=Puccinia striiformis f. sp. tritici TaxID=168172 RepID=A0ACC0E0K0_9BASI|nr:hypothetical protein Pst134EB_023331 [Puccinia striiformis f. sp. tritici]KAI7942640.1 hypothetical protein MJO28_012667 [Puccinia striiformis f. sp. tritici]